MAGELCLSIKRVKIVYTLQRIISGSCCCCDVLCNCHVSRVAYAPRVGVPPELQSTAGAYLLLSVEEGGVPSCGHNGHLSCASNVTNPRIRTRGCLLTKIGSSKRNLSSGDVS